MNRSDKKRFAVGIAVLLVLLTLGVFWPVFRHDFLLFDDTDYVTSNPHVLQGLSWSGLCWAFKTGFAGNWHPLTWVSHMLDIQLFGVNPGWHHAMSLVLHCFNSVLLCLLLRRLTGSLWRSGIVAALFALHPMHVESVAWISERKDLLSGLFFLLTLMAYARYAQSAQTEGHRNKIARAWPWYVLALFLFALGLMSKPMLVTLPCVLLLLDYWPLERSQCASGTPNAPQGRPAVLALVAEKLPFFFLAAASSIITYIAQSHGRTVSSLNQISLSSRLANAFAGYLAYLEKLFWPSDLAILYPFPSVSPVSQAVVSALVLLAITLLVFALRQRFPWALVGWLWFIGMLVPVIGFVQVGLQAYADRYTYLPYIGVFVVLTWGMTHVFERRQFKPAVGLGIGFASVAAFGLLTAFQVRYWKDTCTLFEHTAKVTRGNYMAWTVVGNARCQQERYTDALACFNRALEIAPLFPRAREGLGRVYARMGKTGEALDAFNEALRIDALSVSALKDRGVLLSRMGRYDEAERDLRQAVELVPDFVEARLDLARVLQKTGRQDEAMEEYKRTLSLEPRSAYAQLNLGHGLLNAAHASEALEWYSRIPEASPLYTEALYGSAMAQQTLGNSEAAILLLKQLLARDPKHADAHCQLGILLATKGSFGPAAESLEAALALKPELAPAHFNLGILRDQQGRTAEAIAHYRAALRQEPSFAAPFNNLAWLLATSPAAEFRNGPEAVELAHTACHLTGEKEPQLLGTLAAAYAEAGQFDDAVRTAQQAVTLAQAATNGALAIRNEELLQLYRARRPYRQPAPSR